MIGNSVKPFASRKRNGVNFSGRDENGRNNIEGETTRGNTGTRAIYHR